MISEKENTSPVENTQGQDETKETGKDVRDDNSPRENLDGKSQEELVNDLLDLVNEREELISTVEALEKDRNEAREETARQRAEMYNFRQRMEREIKKHKKLAAESAIIEFLPVLDNLERAISVEESESFTHLLEGVEMVQRQFVEVLKKFGVQMIEARGKEFSPSVHEAVFVSEVDNPEKDGKVLREIQKGFIMADKVIRPSRVEVGKYAGKAEDNIKE